MAWTRPVRTGIVPLRAPISGATFPDGVRGPLHELTVLLLHVTEARGYRCVPGWCWGYYYRRISGSWTWSWHSGGAAVDINAPANPYGPPMRTNMPSWMPPMWEACGWTWGGRWRTPDTMHYEHQGPHRLASDLARARALHAVYVAKIPIPAPKPDPEHAPAPVVEEDDDMLTLVRNMDDGAVWALNSATMERYYVPGSPRRVELIRSGAARATGKVENGVATPDVVGGATVRLYREAPWPGSG